MNPRLAELMAFCREHGTPKLRALRPAALQGYLTWARMAGGLVQVWRPAGGTLALGLGWPVRWRGEPDFDPMVAHDPAGGHLYVANLVATEGSALRAVFEEARRRWGTGRPWLGHRVPKLHRHDPSAPGELIAYPAETWGRVLRASHLPEADRLPAMPPRGADSLGAPVGGVGVLGLLSPLSGHLEQETTK